MAIVYIDPTNTVAGSGTYSNPFQSWGTMTAGNQYLQKAGTTYYGKVSVGNSGTGPGFSQQIVLGSYGEGPKPKIVGTDYCIQISTDKQYITIDGLELVGSTLRGIGNATTASSPSTATYITIKNCEIHDMVNGAVDVNGISLYGAYNKIINNHIYNIPTDCIWFAGDYAEVAYNYCHDLNKDGRNSGDCVQAGIGVINPWIHHNILDHSMADYKQCIMFFDDGTGSGGIIEYNKCYHYNSTNATAAIYGGQPGLIIRRNFVQGGNTCINATQTGITIESNICIPSYNLGISVSTNGGTVRNNTVVGNFNGQPGSSMGIRYLTAGTTCTIRNNIVTGCGTGIYTASTGYVEDHNCSYGNTTNFQRTAATSSVISDPRLDSNYYPQDMIVMNGGTPYTTVDYFGNMFDNDHPSMGAIQTMNTPAYRNIGRRAII